MSQQMRRARFRRALFCVVIVGALVLVSDPSAGAGVGSTRIAHATSGPDATLLHLPAATVVGSSGPELVQSVGANEKVAAKSLTAKFPTATGAGHLLVLSASVLTGTTNRITSVTDSAGNKWAQIGAYAVSGHSSDGEMWYSANAGSARSVTVHTRSKATVALEAQEFSGVAAANPLDVAKGTSNSGTAPSSGSITPSATSDLVVGFLAGHGNPQAMTITGSGYILQPQRTSSAGGVASVVAASKVATSTSAQSLTGSFGAKMYWAAGIAMFKSAANDFSMGAGPAAVEVTAGQATTSTISTTLTSGLAQDVALSASGLPVGASASFTPATVSVGQSSTLTITTSVSTPAGASTVTVTGTGVSATHTTPVSLTVNAAANDFSMGAGPAAVEVTAGQATTSTISTTLTSGLAQDVALSASGLPVGASASFTPATVSAGQSSTLTITTSVSTPAGASTVTVTGTGVSATHTTPVSLTVNASTAIRAAFYYPWFPEAWVQQGQNPFTNYTPARGLYGIDVATVQAQIADMKYGGITLGIASWFGVGTTTDKHWPAIMQAAQGTGFGWAPYYEPEGVSDPTPQQIESDLHYISTTYHATDGSNPAYLPGKGMVVFVYNADDLTQAKGCDTITRWQQARQLLQSQFNENIYLDLKVFPGYRQCADVASVDGWHQYGPASADQNFTTAPGDGSYAISPGYWKSGAAYATAPFLVRDRTRWQNSVAAMNASGARWQLITTYNEWGEGTAIESATGCRNPVPSGTYCDWSAGGTVSDFIADLHTVPPS